MMRKQCSEVDQMALYIIFRKEAFVYKYFS